MEYELNLSEEPIYVPETINFCNFNNIFQFINLFLLEGQDIFLCHKMNTLFILMILPSQKEKNNLMSLFNEEFYSKSVNQPFKKLYFTFFCKIINVSKRNYNFFVLVCKFNFKVYKVDILSVRIRKLNIIFPFRYALISNICIQELYLSKPICKRICFHQLYKINNHLFYFINYFDVFFRTLFLICDIQMKVLFNDIIFIIIAIKLSHIQFNLYWILKNQTYLPKTEKFGLKLLNENSNMNICVI